MASGLPAHVEEADLISYGLVGLITAIERFDLEREIKFETYAITRIKGAIIDELRSLDWVPRSVRARAREIERANAKLEHKLQRAPTDEEMAAELGITVEEFQDSLLQISNSTVAALDELWTRRRLQRRPGVAAGHAAGPGRARPGAASWTRPSSRTASPTRSPACPSARSSCRPLLLREPDAARDRRGPRRDRVARLPAAHQGRAAAALARLTSRRAATESPAAAVAAARAALDRSGARADPPRRGACGMHKPADRIRNVALVGHRGSGKTSLNEALLFQAGAINRLGIGGRRDDGLGRRRRRAGARQMSIAAASPRSSGRTARSTSSTRPGEPELRRRRARRAARLRVGGVRRQRA